MDLFAIYKIHQYNIFSVLEADAMDQQVDFVPRWVREVGEEVLPWSVREILFGLLIKNLKLLCDEGHITIAFEIY